MSRGAGEKLFPSMPRGLAMFVRASTSLRVSLREPAYPGCARETFRRQNGRSTSLALRKPKESPTLQTMLAGPSPANGLSSFS